MTPCVCTGACVQCSAGLSSAPLTVLPLHRANAEGRPLATIMDQVPLLNIPSFGLCRSPLNPAVIAATALAMGVPTPAPCFPAPPQPWIPGSAPRVQLGGLPLLDARARLICSFGGCIQICAPGQARLSQG